MIRLRNAYLTFLEYRFLNGNKLYSEHYSFVVLLSEGYALIGKLLIVAFSPSPPLDRKRIMSLQKSNNKFL